MGAAAEGASCGSVWGDAELTARCAGLQPVSPGPRPPPRSPDSSLRGRAVLPHVSRLGVPPALPSSSLDESVPVLMDLIRQVRTAPGRGEHTWERAPPSGGPAAPGQGGWLRSEGAGATRVDVAETALSVWALTQVSGAPVPPTRACQPLGPSPATLCPHWLTLRLHFHMGLPQIRV